MLHYSHRLHHILILGFRVALVPNTYLKMREILFDSSIAYDQRLVVLPFVQKEPESDAQAVPAVKGRGLSEPIVSTIHTDSGTYTGEIKMDTTTLALDL